MLLLLAIVHGVVFGGGCAILASNKNRDALGWFVAGFCFGIVGLIVIAALTPLDKAKVTEEAGDKRHRDDEMLERDKLRKKSADLAASLAQSRARLNS